MSGGVGVKRQGRKQQRHGEAGFLGRLPHLCLLCIWDSLSTDDRGSLMVTSKAVQDLFAEVVTSLSLDLPLAAQQGPIEALMKRLHPGVKPERLTLKCNFSNAWHEAFSAAADHPRFSKVTHLKISLVSMTESTATHSHAGQPRQFLCLP
jgi:hypothetical protein